MAKKSSYFIGGLAITAVMIGALPAAQSIAASGKEPPVLQVNRSAKGDRLVDPRTIAVKKAPTETAREIVKNPEPGAQPRLMDGCDPLFSPVTVPSMADRSVRCGSWPDHICVWSCVKGGPSA